MATLTHKPFEAPRFFSLRLPAWLRGLLVERREVQKISQRARRERLKHGYRHVPQRVWNRRSALFIEH